MKLYATQMPSGEDGEKMPMPMPMPAPSNPGPKVEEVD